MYFISYYRILSVLGDIYRSPHKFYGHIEDQII